MPTRQTRSRVSAYLLGVLISSSALAQATTEDDLERKKKALDLLASFAIRVCPQPSDKSSTVTLSGQAEIGAKLAGLAKALTEIGFSGAAKYSRTETQGLLQKDVLAAMTDANTCRQNMVNSLKREILDQRVSSAETYRTNDRWKDVKYIKDQTAQFGDFEWRNGQKTTIQQSRAWVEGEDLVTQDYIRGTVEGQTWREVMTTTCRAPLAALAAPSSDVYRNWLRMYHPLIRCNSGECWNCVRQSYDSNIGSRTESNSYPSIQQVLDPRIDIKEYYRALARLISQIGSDESVKDCCRLAN
jgi:hypothetical protein